MAEEEISWCGGCHQWGHNPRMVGGKCYGCDRTEEEIIKTHGLFNISTEQKRTIKERKLKRMDEDYCFVIHTSIAEQIFREMTAKERWKFEYRKERMIRNGRVYHQPHGEVVEILGVRFIPQ